MKANYNLSSDISCFRPIKTLIPNMLAPYCYFPRLHVRLRALLPAEHSKYIKRPQTSNSDEEGVEAPLFGKGQGGVCVGGRQQERTYQRGPD